MIATTSVLRGVILLLCISCAIAEEIRLEYVDLEGRIEAGHLYYSLTREKDEIRLYLINAYGPNLFANKSILTSTVVVKGSKPGNSSFFGGDHSEEGYSRLGYDNHGDGSICGHQITFCKPRPLHYVNEDDLVELTASIAVFFGDKNKDGRLLIDHKGKVSDIPITSSPDTIKKE